MSGTAVVVAFVVILFGAVLVGIATPSKGTAVVTSVGTSTRSGPPSG